MSSKYNNEDRYIGGTRSRDSSQDTAQDAGSRNSGETAQFSAEEIAAVLAKSYLGGRVVSGKESENKGNRDSRSDEERETEEKERETRRRQRVQEMRRRKKRQEQMRRLMLPCTVALVVCVILVGLGISRLVRRHGKQQSVQHIDGTGEIVLNEGSSDITYASTLSIAGCYVDTTIADSIADELALADSLIVRTLGGRSKEPVLAAFADEATVSVDSDVMSENVVFIDVEAGRILGQRGARDRIPPASMTKILTVLVAAEHITDAEDTFVITQDIMNYSFVNGCSNAGFDVGEKVTVKDLFYGTALPSGGEAALGLAVYVAGSQEAFVDLMNEKLEELGLSETTHFTNCIGIYEENHYSTVYDMAVMLKAAYDNSFCREVLGTRIYTTSVTDSHPEGLNLSNLFLRRIEDRDTHGEVLCAKTGYVVQSGNCAASLGIGNDGKIYICVTAHSNDPWICIRDHVLMYQEFLPE